LGRIEERNRMISRSQLIKEIISRIEEDFPQAVVVPTHEGYPEQTPKGSHVQVFEAYGIPENQYERFVELVRKLRRNIARPNGYSIVVHDLTMQETHTDGKDIK
jgi:hypothetical protein